MALCLHVALCLLYYIIIYLTLVCAAFGLMMTLSFFKKRRRGQRMSAENSWRSCSYTLWLFNIAMENQTEPHPTRTPHHDCAVPMCKWTWTLLKPHSTPTPPHPNHNPLLAPHSTPTPPHPNHNPTWSVVSACVCKWTWTLLAPHPTPVCIDESKLCAQMNQKL